MFVLTVIEFIVVSLALCVFAGPIESQDQTVGQNSRAIVGGNDATIGHYPYQVSMRFNGFHTCGGSIINAKWVLTAAHCCYGRAAARVSIRAGSTRQRTGGDIYFAQTIISHEDFNRISLDNDICAIRVSQPFRFSNDVRPISLAPVDALYIPGAFTTVTGWGKTKDILSNRPSEILQSVRIPLISNDQCRAMYSGSGVGSFITERQVCAAMREGGKDSCQGDSGGPLTIGLKLMGIVSLGIGCGDKLFPGIYTRVSAQRFWIKKTTGV